MLCWSLDLFIKKCTARYVYLALWCHTWYWAHTNQQTLQFEERNHVFGILLSVLTKQLPGKTRCRQKCCHGVFYVALVKCSEEFVLGYIQMLDGERDPRNLLLAFCSVLLIVRNLHFGRSSFSNSESNHVTLSDSLVEDLFDVISCYFPIDFSPVSTLFSRAC